MGRPVTERFVGGLFEEWRDVILSEFGRVDPLVRSSVREKVFFNQEAIDFNEYVRARREHALLQLNRASADYLTGLVVDRTGGGGTTVFVCA